MKTCALLLAVTVAAASFGGAQAFRRIYDDGFTLPPPLPTSPAIAATCQAAHDVDARVTTTYCTSTFARPETADADVRSLAEAAAEMGARVAHAAQNTVDNALKKRGVDDRKLRRALVGCAWLYGTAGAAFQAASKAIAERRYGDVGRELEGVSELGRQCDSDYRAAVAGGRSPAPLWIFSGDNQQLAYLTVALTSLIK